MKSLAANFRLIVSAVLVLLVVSLAAQSSPAQSISVSPVALPTGIPTGTTAVAPDPYPASGPETVIVTISPASVGPPVVFGSPVTFSAPAISGNTPPLATDIPADFIIDGTSCNVTFTSPNTCLVTLHFNSSLAPATTLETALLTIASSAGTLTVPLSGAYGSIKLFGETNVSTPSTSTSFTNLYTIASTTENLSCSEGATATLSGTPDGSGYVLVDNYITLATGTALTPVTGIETNNPAGNLCSGTGSTSDSFGDNDYQNCFTEDYSGAVLFDPSLFVTYPDPDAFTNPGNAVLPTPPHGTNNGGVPPISISSFLTSGAQQALFTLLTSGNEGVYDNSTLFLQTTCTTPGGVQPGATITGNPTPVNNPVFDSNPGNSCSMVTNVTQAPPASGTTPVFTLVGVPQQLFYELVAGTSAAADVCLRMSCEQDTSVPSDAPMCAGVLIQCWDPTHTTLSGANCQSATASLLRNAYDSISFDSPDIPLNGDNYLYGPTADTPFTDACSSYLGGTGACATGTGPGLLMGGDAWACAPGSTLPCTPQEPSASTFNTATPAATPGIYTSAAPYCSFAGNLAGDQCPLDITTQYIGEGDGPPGGAKAGGGGSIYFPTVNHPLPTQSATVGQNSWVDSSTANVNFTANAAVYNPGPNNPFYASPANNGFVAAPIYSVTYGITPASSPLPDTTYPVPGDVTTWNTYTNANFGNPLCNVSGTTPSSFDPTVSIATLIASLPDGLYNLHYFATDCALTEGLIFMPQGALTDPTANWASFPVVPFGIDTVAPTFYPYACIPLPNNGMWYGGPGGNITVTCTVNDPPAGDGSYSGFLPLVSGIQGSASEQVLIYTNVAPGTTNASATAGAQTPGYPVGTGSTPSPLQVSDLAGNQVSGGVSASAYQIDLQAPTTVGPSLSAGPYYVGQPITVTFSCSDLGSGVATCAGTGGVISGGTVTPAATGPYTFTVTATDNVGNQSVSSVPYTVGLEPQTITCGTVPPLSEPYNGSFPVSCTATSGLPVALTWSGTACSASSATTSASITMTSGTGSCVVDANQSGNGTYSAATQVQYTVNAALVAQTISCGTAPPLSEAYNGSFPVSCTSSSSLPVALTWSGSACSTGSATNSASITMTSGTGSCVVDANQSGSSNYSAATQLQYTVTAAKVAQTITCGTAPPSSEPYNGSFPVSCTSSSSLPVALTWSGTACSTGSATASANITMTSSTGSCVVDANQAGNGNYSAAPQVPYTVTATLATQTITFTTNAPDSAENGSSFPVAATASSGLAVTLTGSGSCSGSGLGSATITMTSSTGTCTVKASQAGNSNYSAAPTRTETVTATPPPSLSITTTAPCPSFGTLSLGQSAQCIFTVINPAGGTSTAIKVSIPKSGNEGGSTPNVIDPDDYAITANGCPSSLAAGASCPVTVTWKPDGDDLALYATGGSLAYLQIASSKEVLAYTEMTGAAIDPTATLTLGSNTFTTTAAITQMVATVNNPASSVTGLILKSLSITGGGGDFHLTSGTNSCVNGETLVPGVSCYLYVTFTPPKSGSATVTGTVNIPSNATNTPQYVSLSGTR